MKRSDCRSMCWMMMVAVNHTHTMPKALYKFITQAECNSCTFFCVFDHTEIDGCESVWNVLQWIHTESRWSNWFWQLLGLVRWISSKYTKPPYHFLLAYAAWNIQIEIEISLAICLLYIWKSRKINVFCLKLKLLKCRCQWFM